MTRYLLKDNLSRLIPSFSITYKISNKYCNDGSINSIEEDFDKKNYEFIEEKQFLIIKHKILIKFLKSTGDYFDVKVKFITIKNIVFPIFTLLIIIVLTRDILTTPIKAIINIALLLVIQHIGTWSWILSMSNQVEKFIKEIIATRRAFGLK